MYTEKQRAEIINKYIGEMEIIKLRGNYINSAASIFQHLEPAVEFQALQMRKIIEQIILCSLITNSDKYLEYYNKLGKVWNAKYICQEIKKINPQYLPIAVTDIHEKHELKDNPLLSISENDLLEMHEKMGKLLHAHNPFSSKIDYHDYSKYIVDCYTRIVRFLNTHTIKPYGEDSFLYIVMNASNHNGHVAANWFSKVEAFE